MKHQFKRPRCWQGSGASWSVFMDKTGKQSSCPNPVRCYCLNSEQSSPGASASHWSRRRSLPWAWTVGHKLFSGRGRGPWWKPGASSAWIEQLLPAGLSAPVGLVFITSSPILFVGSIHLYWDCTIQNMWEEYIVKIKTCWNRHLLFRVKRLKLLERVDEKIG